MASVEQTISWLEKLPEEIGQKGEQLVKMKIWNKGHVMTGRMFNSVHHEVWEGHARIWVWTRYASYVNDGRGPVYPRHSTKHGKTGWLHWTMPNEVWTRKAAAYPGSHFFDEAAHELDAWCSQL